MNRSYLYLLVIAGLIGGAVVAGRSLAQPRAPRSTPVAVCDVVEIFNNYVRAKDLSAKLNEKRNSLQAESQKRQEKIASKQQMLQQLNPSGPQYEKELSELQRLQFEMEAWGKFQEARIRREHAQLTKEMYEEIIAKVEQIASSRGIGVVLFREPSDVNAGNTEELLKQIERRKVIYWDQRLDLTGLVLRELNDEYKAGSQ